jgi:hypothetical protein
LLLATSAAPSAAQVVLEHPTLYRLTSDSTFQRGCFPPCACPVMQTSPITGTFFLELISVGDVHDFYTVRDISWKVHVQNSDATPIEGGGTYAVSTLADSQWMVVDLLVGDEPKTSYQSDYVAGGAAFPKIAVPISIHGGVCWDTLIDLVARPSPRLSVDGEALSWDPDEEANEPRYDVVQGDLATLLASGGDFALATFACMADGVTATELTHGDAPLPGEGFWFLHRLEGGSYADGDAAQVGSPDAGIALSGAACS